MEFPKDWASGDWAVVGSGFGLRGGVVLPVRTPPAQRPAAIPASGRDGQTLCVEEWRGGARRSSETEDHGGLEAKCPWIPTWWKPGAARTMQTRHPGLSGLAPAAFQQELETEAVEEARVRLLDGTPVCTVQGTSASGDGPACAYASGPLMRRIRFQQGFGLGLGLGQSDDSDTQEAVPAGDFVCGGVVRGLDGRWNGEHKGATVLARLSDSVVLLGKSGPGEALRPVASAALPARALISDARLSPHLPAEVAVIGVDGRVALWDVRRAGGGVSSTCTIGVSPRSPLPPPSPSNPRKANESLAMLASRLRDAERGLRSQGLGFVGVNQSREFLLAKERAADARSSRGRGGTRVCPVCGAEFHLVDEKKFATHLRWERYKMSGRFQDGRGDHIVQSSPRLLERLRLRGAVSKAIGTQVGFRGVASALGLAQTTPVSCAFAAHPRVLYVLDGASRVRAHDLRAVSPAEGRPGGEELQIPALVDDEACMSIRSDPTNRWRFALATTRHVMVVDSRWPSRPLLRWAHFRRSEARFHVDFASTGTSSRALTLAAPHGCVGVTWFRFRGTPGGGAVVADGPQLVRMPHQGLSPATQTGRYGIAHLPPPVVPANATRPSEFCAAVCFAGELSFLRLRLCAQHAAGRSGPIPPAPRHSRRRPRRAAAANGGSWECWWVPLSLMGGEDSDGRVSKELKEAKASRAARAAIADGEELGRFFQSPRSAEAFAVHWLRCEAKRLRPRDISLADLTNAVKPRLRALVGRSSPRGQVSLSVLPQSYGPDLFVLKEWVDNVIKAPLLSAASANGPDESGTDPELGDLDALLLSQIEGSQPASERAGKNPGYFRDVLESMSADWGLEDAVDAKMND